MPIVLVVSGSDAHVGDLAAIFIQRVAAHVTVVLECPVAFVHIEIVGRGVIGHQQVRLAVAIHIHKQSAESVVSVGIVDAQLFAHIGKGPVSVVMKQMVVFALQAARAAHHLDAAILALRIAHSF